MLGYRLVRDEDWDELCKRARDESDKRTHELHLYADRVQSLLRELIDAKSLGSSRAAMYDLITIRVNTLEHDNAVLRNSVTGLPTIVPSIAKGSPLNSASLGAGVDLFADVGDLEARRLQDEGILHDDTGLIPPLPSAADLAPGGSES